MPEQISESPRRARGRSGHPEDRSRHLAAQGRAVRRNRLGGAACRLRAYRHGAGLCQRGIRGRRAWRARACRANVSSSPPRSGPTAWPTATFSARSMKAWRSSASPTIDLLLLHWPNPAIPLEDTIRALNAVKRDGRTQHIGLSNFTSRLLDDAWRLTKEPFAAEQIEYHPYLDQTKMLAALAPARHGDHRLLPDRARQGRRRSRRSRRSPARMAEAPRK